LSILPDVDLLLRPTLQHGGPTHSIILYLVIAFPAILLWKKQTIPYLVAAASHPIIGDYLTRTSKGPGVQLLYPITSSWFSAGSQAAQLMYIYAELILFSVFLILIVATKDIETLIKPHPSNMLLTLPIIAALLPVFTGFPIPVPPQLTIPHLVLILTLTIPVLIDIKHFMSHHSFKKPFGA
jgi:hypothetical protein